MSRSRRSRSPKQGDVYTLFHQTDLTSAEQIILTQTMRPGTSGLFGPGIYFANTIEATDHKCRRTGVYLIADVDLGKIIKITKKQVTSHQIDPSKIPSQGYDSIEGRRLKTGREYVVFDPNRVKNIKFVYGTRPQAVFNCSSERVILFFVTDHLTARGIVHHQSMIKSEFGDFGKAYYMFDTIVDALNLLPNGETYLMAEVKMENFCNMDNNTDSIYNYGHSKTFMAKFNNTPIFIIRYKSLITRIHYCGGRIFEED